MHFRFLNLKYSFFICRSNKAERTEIGSHRSERELFDAPDDSIHRTVITHILFSDEVLGDYKSWNGNPIFMSRGKCLTQASTDDLLAERLALENQGQAECTMKLLAVMGMIMMKDTSKSIAEQLNKQLQKHCLCLREQALIDVCLVFRTILSEFAQIQDFPAQEITKFTASLHKAPEAACTTIKRVLDWHAKHSKKTHSLCQLDPKNKSSVQSALKDLNLFHTKLERMTSYILQLRMQCPEVFEKILRNVSNIYNAQEKIQVAQIACALDIITLQVPNSNILHNIHSRLWPLLKTNSITILYIETHSFMIGDRKICVLKWATDKAGFNLKGAAIRDKLIRGNQLSTDCHLYSFPLYSPQEIRESRKDKHNEKSLQKNLKRNWTLFEDSLKMLTSNSAASSSTGALTSFCSAHSAPFSSKFALNFQLNCDGILLHEAIESKFHEVTSSEYIINDASENLHPASHFAVHFHTEKFNEDRLLSLAPSLEYTDLVQASCDVYGDLKNGDRTLPGCSPDGITSKIKVQISSRMVSAATTRALICYTLSRQSYVARKELEARLIELESSKAIRVQGMQSESLRTAENLTRDQSQSKSCVLNSKKYDSDHGRGSGILSDTSARHAIQKKYFYNNEHENENESESASLWVEDQEHSAVIKVEDGQYDVQTLFQTNVVSHLHQHSLVRYAQLEVDLKTGNLQCASFRACYPHAILAGQDISLSTTKDPAIVTFGYILSTAEKFCSCSCDVFQHAENLRSFTEKTVFFFQEPTWVHNAEQCQEWCCHAYAAIISGLPALLKSLQINVSFSLDQQGCVSVQASEDWFDHYRAMSVTLAASDGKNIHEGASEIRNIPLVKLSRSHGVNCQYFSVDSNETLGYHKRHAIVKCTPTKHFQLQQGQMQMYCSSCKVRLKSLVSSRTCSHIKVVLNSKYDLEKIFDEISERKISNIQINANDGHWKNDIKADFFDTDLANKYKKNMDSFPHTGYVLKDTTFSQRQHELVYALEGTTLRFGGTDEILKSISRQTGLITAKATKITVGAAQVYEISNEYFVGKAPENCPICARQKFGSKRKNVTVYAADGCIVCVKNVEYWMCCSEVADEGVEDCIWFLSSTLAVHEQVIWDCVTLMFNGHVRNLNSYCAIFDQKVKLRMLDSKCKFISQQSFTVLLFKFLDRLQTAMLFAYFGDDRNARGYNCCCFKRLG